MPLMDISKTIASLKAEPGFLEKVGMVLVHNGVARATSRNGAPVASLDVVVDQDLVETIRQEGEAKAYLKINGAWADHLLFGVVSDDWVRDA